MGKNFVKLSPNDIGIDAAYQRDLDEGRVEAMAKKFDESRTGVPVVSLRKDSTYVVLDGQHRLQAMRQAGLENLKILCEAHNGLSTDEEAAMFLKLNNGRKPVSVHDKYKARMVAKEPIAIEFTRIIQSLGLRIGRAPGKNSICAIQSVESVHKRNGNLEATLLILKKWGKGDAVVFDGNLITDVSRFLIDHSALVNVDEFITRLSRIDPGHVLRRIKATSEVLNRNRRLAANSVFREIYNHRRSKADKLYAVEEMAQA